MRSIFARDMNVKGATEVTAACLEADTVATSSVSRENATQHMEISVSSNIMQTIRTPDPGHLRLKCHGRSSDLSRSGAFPPKGSGNDFQIS